MEFLYALTSKLPYHNRGHASDVVGNLVSMGIKDTHSILAGAGHDLLHTGTPREDDERIAGVRTAALAIVHGSIQPQDAGKIIHKIDGTVFKNRGHLDGEQVHLADADIAVIGGKFEDFIRNVVRLFIENCLSQGNLTPTHEEYMDFWHKDQEKFYTYLVGITGDVDNPFLTQEAKAKFPHFARNRDRLREIVIKDPNYLVGLLRNEWKKYFGQPLHMVR